MSSIVAIENYFLKYTNSNLDQETSNETEALQKVLNSMFGKRVSKVDDKVVREEKVSTIPATRNEVIGLSEALDMALQEHQARETGICPIRRQLYNHCFDELIRQTTINCVEQGSLLFKIKNEIQMTLDAYDEVIDSAFAFEMRSVLKNQYKAESNDDAVKTLNQENLKLKMKINQMENESHKIVSEKEEIIKSLKIHFDNEIKQLQQTIHQQRMLIKTLKRKPIQL